MTDAIQELKIRAQILHRKVRERDGGALARLRALPELRRAAARELGLLAGAIRRRHCLAVIAAELGFPSWHGAKSALQGTDATGDFGDLLYPRRCGSHLNLWYARYEDAALVRRESGRYLLAYRRQFLVVEREFIETLGLDPDDGDWERIGFDWVRPRDSSARSRLYGKLVAGWAREGA